MSDETTNPVVDAINKMVEEKTFGLDALARIQQLRELAEKQAKDLQYRERSLQDKKYECEQWRAKYLDVEKTLQTWQKREDDLRTREARCHEAEKAEAVAKAVADTYDTIFLRMFANRVTRESIQENATRPVNTPSGPFSMSETSSRKTERSEK